MNDLTNEQLAGMDMWDRDVMFEERHRAAGSMLVRMAVAEIRRHRAEIKCARVNAAAAGVTEDGPIDQTVCTLACMLLEARAAHRVDAARIAEVVREAIGQAFEAFDYGYNANRAEMVDHAVSRASVQLAGPEVGAPTKATRAEIDRLLGGGR